MFDRIFAGLFEGQLVFASPWILGFLVLLPVVWWLLRLTPPSPRKVVFPALMLLRGLATPQETPARTPWWILLLRLVIAALVIAAFADPLLDPEPVVPGGGDVLIVIDNDWAAARDWDARHDALHHFIDMTERENRNVILLPTAPPANGEAIQLIGPMAAKAAYAYADRLTPMPWPSDWGGAKALLGKLEDTSIAYDVWLNSGLGNKAAGEFYDVLKADSKIMETRVLSDMETPIYSLAPPQGENDANLFAVMRAETESAATLSVTEIGAQGQTLGHTPVNFTAGAPRANVTLDMPIDVHNQIVRLEIEGQRSAAAVALLDENWLHKPVGIVGDRAEVTEHSFLSAAFYIDRALKPYADIHIDRLDKLLTQNMAVIVLTDSASLNSTDIEHLVEWIKKGGVLLRFAGDRLASGTGPHEMELLPVALRTGDRAMGGTMSWATPQKLRPFSASSPFQGLDIPDDVAVTRQVLAEPAADLAQKSWATLQDGTPLVTAKPLGGGLSILFHVPARSEWSNLPLSGLFVEMLRRIVDLSHASNAGAIDFSAFAPLEVLDGFGDTQQPGSAVQPIAAGDFSRTAAGPKHPPGYYGTENFKHAFNLGTFVGQPEAIKDIPVESYRINHTEKDLQPPLLALALILLLADFVLSLWLRGIMNFARTSGRAAVIAFIFVSSVHAAQAADDKAAVELTSKTYLAYIETGNGTIDHVSESGLNGLARVLQRRTSIDKIGVTGVNPATDELVFFPLLYWPLNPASQPVSQKAAERINNYLHHGGMILFDSGYEGGALSAMQMQALLAGIDVPPLVRIPDNHVLCHSFYLLDEFPGRNGGGDLWLEPEEMATFDGVAAVIAGSGDWAGAWAVDDNGRPLYPCTPGGEAQREYAYRFGVNLVMYALTGNYKSDQMHAQALLERLGK